ncbi:hypothetical protein Gotri_005611 [Gossypium trilobum]|uniref:Uncharacterized protein n=1 Tax=Gossypium trilobum TaxID=34281 RepID=A0A7J9EX35_9ROSI|nr:hypothetical protein [Gossypium trilobum]
MLISRLCRVGFQVAKELSRGGYAYMSRSRYTQRHCCQYQWSTVRNIGLWSVNDGKHSSLSALKFRVQQIIREIFPSSFLVYSILFGQLELLPETRAFQGSIFQKYHGFSTSASDGASAGADEEKGTISVTFVSKDGEEIPIQVPIGMSMLEAAHENDIELEGKDHNP